METEEIQKIILQSEQKEWFNSVTTNIDYLNVSHSLIGITSVHQFLSEQIAGWDQLGDLPNQFKKSKTHFVNMRNRVEQFVRANYNQPNKQSLENLWNTEQSRLQANRDLFTHGSPETLFLIGLHQESSDMFGGAYSYITSSNIGSTKNEFTGALLAYEFESKGNSKLTQRIDIEQRSMEHLRNDFTNFLNNSNTQFNDHISGNKKRFEEHISTIEEFKNNQESLFEGWFSESQENLETLRNDALKKRSSLEDTYEDLLRLKKPAEYWSQRAKSLRVQGWISFVALCVFVGFVAWFLSELLWKPPEEIYKSFFSEDKSTAIRWSLIYITFISFMVFCIRAITKVMFSSFHLARDCEERNTLTYFYLSLINDSKIEKEDRQLIMQSLFSRADTGLLNDDSGPTMPNDIVNRVLRPK